MAATITIPAVPEGLRAGDCWRRRLTGLDESKRGGFQIDGDWLGPGDEAELPDGALLLRVDQAVRGWEVQYGTLRNIPQKDATVTLYLVADGGLVELWSRQYVQKKSAFGAFTMKKLRGFLDAHPVPEKPVVIVREARRPNRRAEACRWCAQEVRAEQGHVAGHGESAQVEHYEQCPTQSVPETGQECAVCGVAVIAYQAERHFTRAAPGESEVRHRLLDGRDCVQEPRLSPEEDKAQRAAADRERQERAQAAAAAERKKAQEKAERARRRREKKEAEHAAEQERIAGLATVSRSTKVLYDKGLDPRGLRVRLEEHTDLLEDDTTTKRYSVVRYQSSAVATAVGGDGDDPAGAAEPEPFTRLDWARDRYREFTYDAGSSYRDDGAAGGGICAECGRLGAEVERRDSSGIPGKVCRRCDWASPDDYMLSFA